MSGERQRSATSGDVLRLVQRALDEFDEVPLEATLRRVIRIASLLGDTRLAIRLGLELRATGGHPPANAEMTRRLMANPETWDDEEGVAIAALNEYMEERRFATELVMSHSVAEMEFWQSERQPVNEMTDDQYRSDLETRLKMLEALTRARYKAFTALCGWERQLTFAVVEEDALAAVNRRVEVLLAQRSPEVLDQFIVAFRRLRESAERDSEAEAQEELSQALTSCRRILKAIVDAVQPADPARVASEDGHPLTEEHYKNRLFEFLKGKVASDSFGGALSKIGESLFDRFSAMDRLASKGVHAQVALVEAEFCALHTYTLAGEVLVLAELSPTE